MPGHSVIDFEAIKRSVSLSEVLSRFVRLPSSARVRYRIPCPVHGGDAWNSFSVDDERGLFHCFVCGVGGDVVSLLAKLEGITNIEAGRRLTEEFKVQPGQAYNTAWDEVKRWQPKGPLPVVALPVSDPLTEYRGYSREAIRHFGLSKVPQGILIPFRDEGGRFVGYAIRQTDREPKYLNNKGFEKSEVIYGLYECKEFLAVVRQVIVCEGQFDCIRVWDSGYSNVVATMGATMSPTQATTLAKYVDKITVLYDGDEAGRRGASKIKEAYSSLFNIEIKHLPEGQDPDGADLRVLNEAE